MYNTTLNEYNSVKTINRFISKVYNFMIAAMLISWAAAYLVNANKMLFLPLLTWNLFYVLIIIEIWLVFMISFLLNRISFLFALVLFILYSFINWLTISIVLFAYNTIDIVNAFLITSWTFLFMSLYWYKTETDLTSFWKIMIMWLFGIIIASVINIFLWSSGFSFVISWISVIIFTWLVAYDTQMLKTLWESSIWNEEDKNKLAIIWALTLYLDFVNLFLNLLRLLWGSRD